MDKIQQLEKEIAELKQLLYKNNFSNLSVFDKDVQFNSRIKIFNKTANLSTCNTGELSVVGGKLYICSAAPSTWVCVGDQTA